MANNLLRLDETFALFKHYFEIESHFQTSEPFVVNPTSQDHTPFRALTLLIDGVAFAIFGLTVNNYSIQSIDFLHSLIRRAQARKVCFLVLTNLSETQLRSVSSKPGDSSEIQRNYPLLVGINSDSTQPLTAIESMKIKDLAIRIGKDLQILKRDGHLFMDTPDADYFVSRLVRAVNVLKPLVRGALQTEIRFKPGLAKELVEWAIPQGIPADLHSDLFAEAIVRQAIYRLLGKIIFYQSLKRAVPDLPEMNVSGLDTSQVLVNLRQCFNAAHKIDYHAVFREDIVDRLPFPASASSELKELVEDLNTRDFAHLPQDVIGAVFERLIPPEDRHALGQFFTKETLVDLIVGFCVRNAEDFVLDATCGTGTFLMRSYDRKRIAFGLYDHNQQLSRLWGIDIAPFPAELATINLFRQQVGQAGNFPRILNDDFFNIVPGGKYRFPPLKASSPMISPNEYGNEIEETIPYFDAIIGNFPYISADRIESREKDYKKRINHLLAKEWFQSYPDGFIFLSKNDQKQHQRARQQGLDVTPFLEKAEPFISSSSDFYVYLFWHAAAFLKPGGRIGIITSNAWLDVGFGYPLQRFFLDHFKIIAILESRCEPWFEQAAVNTVITILERCDSAEDRNSHPARFVKIKRLLSDLIPWDMHLSALDRWIGIGKIIQRIESVYQASEDPLNPNTFEDKDFRIRIIKQGVLHQQLCKFGKTVKWGPYLRAPQVYFDLLKYSSDKLTLLRTIAPPTRGSLTGINEFFHFDDGKIKQWKIEPEFLHPILKSPSETDRILIDQEGLRLKVFICRETKEELLKKGKLNALRYIEWGEKQVFTSGPQAGLTWPHGATVKDRKPGWYAIPYSLSQPANLFFAGAYGEKHIHKYSEVPLIADKRLYFLLPDKNIKIELISAILNSSITALMTELSGRVPLGDGALELTVEDAADYLLIPNINIFDDNACNDILESFQPLLKRSIGSVFDEIQQPDRQALDRAILQAMGLTPDDWLPQIYSGLSTLVRERIQLGQMRSQTRKSKPQKAAGRVVEDIIKELLPHGPQKFPDQFYSSNVRSGKFKEIILPQKPFRYVGYHFGKEELRNDDGLVFYANNRAEVLFLLYCQANKQTIARLPDKPIEISRTVNEYKKYLRDLRQQLYEAYFRRTLDQAQAQRLMDETWRKLDLPDPEI